MSKHQIFLLHGMGSFTETWASGIEAQIRQLFTRYDTLRKHKLVDLFEFTAIRYDTVFEAWRKQWADDAKAAATALVDGGITKGFAKQLVDLAGQAGGGGFLRTHVLDVLAWRFLPQFRDEVRRTVQHQILKQLKTLPAGTPPHPTIIAHSLGTAVAYETYHAMIGEGLDSGEKLAPAFLPDNVFMLANVARPLWTRGGPTPYPASMAPNLGETVGWCLHMANFSHEIDPVAQIGPFNPPAGWFKTQAPREDVYADITLRAADVQDENVHAFEHYLSHPAVHVHMLRRLTRPSFITQDEHNAALREWRDNTLPAQQLAAAKAKLKGLVTGLGADWSSRIAVLQAVREIALNSQLKGGEKLP